MCHPLEIKSIIIIVIIFIFNRGIENQDCMVLSQHDYEDLVFSLFVLRFYGPVEPMGSC